MNMSTPATDAQASWIASGGVIDRSRRIAANAAAAARSNGNTVAAAVIACS